MLRIIKSSLFKIGAEHITKKQNREVKIFAFQFSDR